MGERANERLVVSKGALVSLEYEHYGPRRYTASVVWAALSRRVVGMMTDVTLVPGELPASALELPEPLFLRDIAGDIYMRSPAKGGRRGRTPDTIGQIVDRDGVIDRANWYRALAVHHISKEQRRSTQRQLRETGNDTAVRIPAVEFQAGSLDITEVMEHVEVFRAIDGMDQTKLDILQLALENADTISSTHDS